MAGRVYAGYDLLGRIASGGMAEILLARRFGGMGFEKLVALKRLLPMFSADPDYVAMFGDEARILGQLRHPNVVQALDFGNADGHWYIALEYVHGESLAALMTRTRERGETLSPATVAYVGAAVARALHAAHEAVDADGRRLEVLHRDVSPHNVLLGYDGVVKLVDFGVAHAKTRHAHSKVGVVKGKLAYMAPEQLEGAPADRRADLFALGIVLWETASCGRLFRRETDAATVRHVLEGPIPRLREVAPAMPPELDTLVARMLTRDADGRPGSALEVARKLDEIARRQMPFDEAAMATLMSQRFAAERARKEEMLRVALAPSLDEFLFGERPDAALEWESLESSAVVGEKTSDAIPRRRGRRRSLVVSLAASVLLALLAAPSRPPEPHEESPGPAAERAPESRAPALETTAAGSAANAVSTSRSAPPPPAPAADLPDGGASPPPSP